jgi:hypothetical protein
MPVQVTTFTHEKTTGWSLNSLEVCLYRSFEIDLRQLLWYSDQTRWSIGMIVCLQGTRYRNDHKSRNSLTDHGLC